MINIDNKKECTGCGVCYNVCPKKCIEMLSDDEGFKYPKVDIDRCINCGICESRCPILNNKPSNRIVKAFAAKSKFKDIQLNSSSGGIFYHIASAYLKNNCKVFAAAFNEDFVLQHSEIESEKYLFRYMGSKYIQSDINDCYFLIKSYLDKGEKVAFIGTPCQVAALKNYLEKDYSSLLTIDFICHGVPSPLCFELYYKSINKYSKLRDVEFRNKAYGWNNFSMVFSYEDGTVYKNDKNHDLFLKCFFDNVFLRPSCYACKYKALEKHSDVTLADFWGINRIDSSKFDNDGVSAILINSQKGAETISSLSNELILSDVAVQDIIDSNSALVRSAINNRMRNVFFRRINKMDIQKNMFDCLFPSIKTRIKLKLFH